MTSKRDLERLAQAVNYEVTVNDNVPRAKGLANILAVLSKDGDDGDESGDAAAQAGD